MKKSFKKMSNDELIQILRKYKKTPISICGPVMCEILLRCIENQSIIKSDMEYRLIDHPDEFVKLYKSRILRFYDILKEEIKKLDDLTNKAKTVNDFNNLVFQHSSMTDLLKRYESILEVKNLKKRKKKTKASIA